MTGSYRHDEKDKTLWIYKDYTDPVLKNDFLAKLIKILYLKVPVKLFQLWLWLL